jgi:DNA helicase HerA-like ATPase
VTFIFFAYSLNMSTVAIGMTMRNPNPDPTRLGTVEDVTGSTLRIKLGDDTAHGLLFVRGEGYRVGQVGSFVRIPVGYCDLFGIVSQVGAGAAPVQPEGMPQALGTRWLRVELVGEGRRGSPFERGVSQYPSIGDQAHVVTESDLQAIYAPGDEDSYVAIGRVASAESIKAHINLNRLVTRHSAVVGSTGAGKSTAVASLLASLSDSKRFPAARVVLLDLHGEYAKALSDRSTVFRINPPTSSKNEPLCVPFWALAFDELLSLCFGSLDDKQRGILSELVVTLKKEGLNENKNIKMQPEDITSDTPVPFSIRELWFRQHFREHRMVMKKQGGSEEEQTDAFVLDDKGEAQQKGDSDTLTPPKFRTSKTTGPREEQVSSANEGASLRQQMAGLHSKLRDERLKFLFSPGDWNPDKRGKATSDLDTLISKWLCNDRPISILDLSGVPASVLDNLVAALLRILFDALYSGRSLKTGGRHRPLLIVLEEAHFYLTRKDGQASAAAKRIAKEGRKYGVGMMLVSQRPSEIDPTILSQCGTIIALRLTNEQDRGQIKSCSSDNLEGLFSMLSILRTGEALMVGEAVSMPTRALIELPAENRRPDSEDPKVVVPLGSDQKKTSSGGWTDISMDKDYSPLVSAWRGIDETISIQPKPKTKPKKE